MSRSMPKAQRTELRRQHAEQAAFSAAQGFAVHGRGGIPAWKPETPDERLARELADLVPADLRAQAGTPAAAIAELVTR